MQAAGAPSVRIMLPDAPIVAAGVRHVVVLTADGEIEEMDPRTAARALRQARPILCHRLAVAARLKCEPFACADLLELWAFVRPAAFCVPTVRGLCEALDLGRPESLEDQAQAMVDCALVLLRELADHVGRETAQRLGDMRGIAFAMATSGWAWGPSVLAALGVADGGRGAGARALRVWDRLSEWSEHAPEPPPGSVPVEPGEARTRLAQALGPGAESRPQQADYASAVCHAFQPRDAVGEPNVVLAEAGTGTGKTLGYVAPASLWAQKNAGTVWISTYTRNLQRQLDAELTRLYPGVADKARKVVVRKGRENYLCLLNYEEALGRVGTDPQAGVALGLMARWALATRDGDMVGGDFPGWLPDLLGRGRSLGLTDRRGECVFAACPHYRKCFIERTIRRARRAEVVVANHALVMVQAALGSLAETAPPTRYVFDEGHHVFEAADSAFAAHLTGAEAGELRRWLLGAEEGARSRARGLKRRIEDLIAAEEDAVAALDGALQAARCLPGPAWHQRIADGQPKGSAEEFLAAVRRQVYARAGGGESSPYSLEAEPNPPLPELADTAATLALDLQRLAQPLKQLAGHLSRLLDDEAAELETATRQRIESICRSIERRALLPLGAWTAMLGQVGEGTPEQFVDWLSVERMEGRDVDAGLHRHWGDPTVPFSKAVCEPAHGVVVTSATLRDGTGHPEIDWEAAECRTGAIHLRRPALRAAVASPFDYPAQTRVLVVTDVRKDDLAQVAAAYRELFLAAGGGGLGLFTAISRLRAVHERIAAPLEDAGIPLLAQHVDGLDTATLVDVFRAEEDACLLGTDAVRDGVDVPGRSLRLLVFDRVPWPRPDILHKARRALFGGKDYDDMITRLRLKQAYGRLVRRAGDHGVFVLLDPMMPSRLSGAFPDGVPLQRVGLAEAVRVTREFLG